MFTTDCNRFSVIQRTQKRDLDFTDNLKLILAKFRMWKSCQIRSNSSFFVQNYCSIALQRPFDTLMVPYWNIAFFMSIDIKTSKYQVLSITQEQVTFCCYTNHLSIDLKQDLNAIMHSVGCQINCIKQFETLVHKSASCFLIVGTSHVKRASQG